MFWTWFHLHYRRLIWFNVSDFSKLLSKVFFDIDQSFELNNNFVFTNWSIIFHKFILSKTTSNNIWIEFLF